MRRWRADVGHPEGDQGVEEGRGQGPGQPVVEVELEAVGDGLHQALEPDLDAPGIEALVGAEPARGDRPGRIELLPALPSAMPAGTLTGVRTVAGVRVARLSDEKLRRLGPAAAGREGS